MFGSNSPFGQSASSPFSSQSTFGQNNVTSNPFAPKPFGAANPFGSQTGASIFGSTSTGVFGQSSSPLSSTPAFGATSSPGFGSSTPAFGNTSSSFGGSSVFGQKPAFGGFGSSTQASPFGSSFQQSQPAFGSNLFGSSSPFGASSQPSFGGSSNPTFGSSTTPGFGAATTSAFGSTPTPTFGSTGAGFGVSTAPAFGSGATSTPVFGAATAPAFGTSSTPAFGGTTTSTFGATTTPAFGTTTTPAFGATTTSAFGATSTPAFGTTAPSFGTNTSPSFSFGSNAAFGQSTPTFGSTPFGSTPSTFGAQTSPFGTQTPSPAFGSGGFGQSNLGGQPGGTRVAAYTPTQEADSGSNAQPGKLESISAMAVYKDKSHEELRWEDYQRGDKGGPNPAGQSTSSIGFGVSTAQSNPFASTNLGQTSSNPFSTTAQSNPFTTKPPAFGTPGFGTATTSAFGTSAFTGPSTSSPFGSSPAPTSSIFQTSATFGTGASPSLFGGSTQVGSTSLFGSTPSQGTATSFGSTLSFANTQSSPLFQSTTSSFGQTGPAFGQTGSSFGQTGGFGSNLFNSPSTGIGTSLFSNTPAFSTSNFAQTTSALSTPFQPTPSTQTGSTFNFSNFGPSQSAGTGGFGVGSSIFGQNLGQTTSNLSTAVAQPVAVTNPFGTLPAMPHMSIGNSGTAPSVQYGISSMPVVDKPTPVRISSLLTSRHLTQRRIRLPARKYHPKNDGSMVPFFAEDDEAPSTPKADALFIPRENPRSLIIRPVEQWPSKLSTREACVVVHENGKSFKDDEHPLNGSLAATKDNGTNENGSQKEQGHPTKINQKPGGPYDGMLNHKGDSYIPLSGHRAGEAAIVYEHGADIEAMMPKLRHSDYYTEPRIQELAAKERAEPGFCRRVKDFVVGRHGYGSIKFLGETDVRRLDLESLIQFNNREVIVYMDDSKKPPVGQGLNKPAEVTLLNIKCFDKKSGNQILEGPRIEKYKEMLKKKAEDQGAEFLSYDPVKGEWKFRVSHFSKYMLCEDDLDEEAALC